MYVRMYAYMYVCMYECMYVCNVCEHVHQASELYGINLYICIHTYVCIRGFYLPWGPPRRVSGGTGRDGWLPCAAEPADCAISSYRSTGSTSGSGPIYIHTYINATINM
jgi:hypothetical protein